MFCYTKVPQTLVNLCGSQYNKVIIDHDASFALVRVAWPLNITNVQNIITTVIGHYFS